MKFSYPFLEHYLCQLECEGNEIFHAEALWTELKYWVGNELCELFLVPAAAVCLGTDEWFERVAESLAALVESGLHNSLEECFVATEICALVADKSDDS